MKRCFVLMPFTSELSWIHGELVKAGEAAGYSVERADDIFSPGVVIDQVERRIVESDAVIAVCTGRNANVFYELGLAHPVHQVILIAQSDTDLPFDIAHRRAIIYGTKPVALAGEVTRALEALSAVINRPVLQHTSGEDARRVCGPRSRRGTRILAGR